MQPRRVSALMIAATLALAACGGSEPDSAAPAAQPQEGSTGSPLPAITVQDVTADKAVALNSFIPSDRPTLLWFWAPH